MDPSSRTATVVGTVLLLLALLVGGLALWAHRASEPQDGGPVDDADAGAAPVAGFPRSDPEQPSGSPAERGARLAGQGGEGASAKTGATARYDARIEVLVRTAGGAPVSGYLVEAFAPSGGAGPAPGRTDAQGTATFEGLWARDGWSVRVSDEGGIGPVFAVHRRADLGAHPVVRLDLTVADVTVAGRVVDAESKEPVPGAAVRGVALELASSAGSGLITFRIEASEARRPVASTITSAEGRFELVGPWRYLRIEAEAQGERRGEKMWDPTDPRTGLVIEVARVVRTAVHGIVEDEAGKPLPGARLVFERGGRRQPATPTPITATTDAAGRFSMEPQETGFRRVRVIPTDGPPTVGSLRIVEGRELRIVVPVATSLAATVTDEATGAPVAGATIQVDGPWNAGKHTTQVEDPATDERGHVRVLVPPGPIASLRVRAAGYPEAWLQPSETERGALVVAPGSDIASPLAPGETRVVAFRLRRGATVTGRVLFEDGRPAAGARVHAEHRFTFGARPTTIAGHDGRFRLEGVLPPEAYAFDEPQRIVASLAGYAPAAVTPRTTNRPGAASSFGEDVGNLVLWRVGTFRGRVVDGNGQPIPGARVQTVPHTYGAGGDGVDPLVASTDDQGWYVVGAGTDRRARLRVSASGYREAWMSSTPGLPPPGSVADIDPIVLAAAGTLRVRVLDPSGQPLAGVHVLALGSFSGKDLEAAPTTDAEGWVNINPGAGRVSLLHLLREDGARFEARRSDRADEGDQIVRLPATRPVEGRVVDGEGRAVGFAHVQLEPDRDPGRDRSEAQCDPWIMSGADGAFRAAGVPQKAYRLEVKASGFVTRLVDVAAGARMPLEVVLERFGDAHRKRLTELQEQIRALEDEIARHPPSEARRLDDRQRRVFELQQEASRLTGE